MEEEYLNAAQAAEYLRQKWNLESWDVAAFRQYRYRLRKKAQLPATSLPAMPNSSVWRKSELDAMPEPDRVMRRQKKTLDDANTAMVCYA